VKESTLWDHLKPELSALGKFQKISDRFTPGVPDVLGCFSSTGYAIELKQLKGIRIFKTKFRPGQLDWLQDWHHSGGRSWIVSSIGQRIFVHGWGHGEDLEKGMTEERLLDTATSLFVKNRKTTWKEFVQDLLQLQ
jgi:hypothetical protein